MSSPVQSFQEQVQKQVANVQKQFQEQVSKTTEASNNIATAYKKLNDINTQLVSGLLRQQLELFNIYSETSLAQLQALGAVKQPQDIVGVQTKAVQELNKKVLGNTRATYELLVDGKAQLTAWVESSVKAASAYSPFSKAA
jgi:phasin family protein